MRKHILFRILSTSSLLLFYLAISPSNDSIGKTLPEAIDSIRPSIVQIAWRAEELSEDMIKQFGKRNIIRVAGTGFIVSSEGHVITANHVIENVLNRLKTIKAKSKELITRLVFSNIEIEKSNTRVSNNFYLIPFKIIERDINHDIALLKLEENPFSEQFNGKRPQMIIQGREFRLSIDVVAFNETRPRDGTAIGVSGYPFGEPALVTTSGYMATSWAVNLYSIPSPNNPMKSPTRKERYVYLGNIVINPGNSGGPVYLVENSSVIGVCISNKATPEKDEDGKIPRFSLKFRDKDGTIHEKLSPLLYSSNLAVIVPISNVIEILEKNNVKWKKFDSEK